MVKSNLRDTLNLSEIVEKKPCPRCRKKGEDTSGDNLCIYSDHEYCFKCGYTKQYSSGRGMNNKKRSSKSVSMLPNVISCEGIKHKHIGYDSCEFYGVKELLLLDADYITPKLKNGQPVPAGEVIFPYFDDSNKLTGLKYRDYYSEIHYGKDKNKTITSEGTLTLFGLNKIDFFKDEIIIWEGEPDCLLAYELDKTRNHIALPGAQFTKRVAEYLHVLRRFKKVYVAMDNDTAGDEAREKLEEILPSYLTWHINYSEFDVNDLGEIGFDPDTYDILIDKAYQRRNLLLISGLELRNAANEYFEEEAKYQFIDTGFVGVNDMLGGGLSTGECLGLVSHTGRGKSTLCCNIAYNLAEQGLPVMWVGTEMLFTQMMRKFIERKCGKRLIKHGTEWSITKEERTSAIEQLSQSIVFFNETTIDYDELEETVVDAVYKYGIRVLFIDVINDIDPQFGQWTITSKIMHRLATLTAGSYRDKRHPISTIAVCHTKAVDGVYSDKLSISDIGGGAAVHRNLTSIIGMNGDIHSPDRELVLLKKSRMNDNDGLSNQCKVTFDTKQRRYKEFQKSDRGSGRKNARRKLAIRTNKARNRDNDTHNS